LYVLPLYVLEVKLPAAEEDTAPEDKKSIKIIPAINNRFIFLLPPYIDMVILSSKRTYRYGMEMNKSY